ncbi:hypothetical protein SKAU_G00306540 [Synaphobranchus kaupii]|uniref:Uncharacterized protein n=1 Tax=Synaphobranchus kaupii TaxID=118154 RepID=A0A9Q1EQW1_SYNKA|nr:hypothetical protein SKAU_G00306540 [Synaphobranchus kaupii]
MACDSPALDHGHAPSPSWPYKDQDGVFGFVSIDGRARGSNLRRPRGIGRHRTTGRGFPHTLTATVNLQHFHV